MENEKRRSRILRRLHIVFQESQRDVPNRARLLLQQVKNFRAETRICVNGVTGAGKTAFLSRLCYGGGDSPLLASSNQQNSSTSAVCVEIRRSTTAQFTSVVSFKAKEEWERIKKNCCRLLKIKWKQKEIQEEEAEQEAPTGGSNKTMKIYAQAILNAVYGANFKAVLEKPDFQELESVQKALTAGEQVKQYTTLEEIQKDLKVYTSSLKKEQGLWPLISLVKVYVPTEKLPHGIVLVDLPGVADEIEERVKIAQQQRKKCDIVWTAFREGTKIGADTQAKQIVSDLIMDGLLPTLSVIITRQDSPPDNDYENNTDEDKKDIRQALKKIIKGLIKEDRRSLEELCDKVNVFFTGRLHQKNKFLGLEHVHIYLSQIAEQKEEQLKYLETEFVGVASTVKKEKVELNIQEFTTIKNHILSTFEGSRRTRETNTRLAGRQAVGADGRSLRHFILSGGHRVTQPISSTYLQNMLPHWHRFFSYVQSLIERVHDQLNSEQDAKQEDITFLRQDQRAIDQKIYALINSAMEYDNCPTGEGSFAKAKHNSGRIYLQGKLESNELYQTLDDFVMSHFQKVLDKTQHRLTLRVKAMNSDPIVELFGNLSLETPRTDASIDKQEPLKKIVPWDMIDDTLRKMNKRRMPVAGDGNCLFHALAMGQGLEGEETRKILLQYLREVDPEIRVFYNEVGLDLEAELAKFDQPGYWGGAEILVAAMRAFGRHIIIIHEGATPIRLVHRDVNAAELYLAWNGVHYDAVLDL